MLLRRDLRLAEFADTTRSKEHRQAAIAEANRLLERVIEKNPDDPRRFEWQFVLGNSLVYDEAEPFYRMALSLAVRTYGPDHLDVAVYLANLATLYQDLGREDEATPLFERALGIGSAPEETL